MTVTLSLNPEELLPGRPSPAVGGITGLTTFSLSVQGKVSFHPGFLKNKQL